MAQIFLRAVEYLMAFSTIFVTVFLTLVYFLGKKKPDPIKPTRHPAISVLVPAYNEEKFLASTLRSLLALKYPKDKLDIVVINDGSTDNTAGVARGFSKFGVRLIDKRNTGKADSLNYALKHTKSELVATMDGDSYASPDALMHMVGHFENPAVGAVAASVYAQNPKNLLGEIQRIEYLFAIFLRRILEQINCVTVTPGPFSLFRRSAIEKVGGFDPKSLVEDQEIALNMQGHGYSIATSPDARIYSEIPRTFSELMKQRVRWQRGGFYNAMKYHFLIGAKNGDFGLVVMPYTVLGYASLTLLPVLIVFNAVSASIYERTLGIEGTILSFSPIHIFSAVMLFISFYWLYFEMRKFFRGEKINPLLVLVFLVIYPLLMVIFWIFAAFKEITHQAKRW